MEPSATVFVADTIDYVHPTTERNVLMIMTQVAVRGAVLGTVRTLIVALALIPLVLVILASMPGLVIMPFTRDGWNRAEMYLVRLTAWTAAVLTNNRTVH